MGTYYLVDALASLAWATQLSCFASMGLMLQLIAMKLAVAVGTSTDDW